MIKKILITGGSGMIGMRLSKFLLQKGYLVNHLSRSSKNYDSDIGIYHWDVKKGQIENEAILSADCIVHLAGAGIADKRWT
ncbi:MAG: NAD-dependent epimerase/dehydratase family protein, partial [Chitinophagales bacterium]